MFPEYDFIDPKLGFSRRLADCVGVIARAAKKAKEVGARHIVIDGDLFHRMGIMHVESFNIVFFAVKAAAQDHHVHLVRGNHDQATKDGRVHSLLPFQEIKHVKIEEGASTLKDAGDSIDVAWIGYQDNERASLKAVRHLSGRPLAFLHHGFRGARVGSTLELVVKEPLDPTEVGKHFGVVFSGHYHRLQFVHDNVLYIGSPLEHTRSDASEDAKGFLVLDTEKLLDPEFVPYPAPRFVKMKAGDQLKIMGNYVDYYLGPKEKSADVTELLKHYKARAWRIYPYVEPKLKLQKSERRVDLKPGMGIANIVRASVKKRCPSKLNPKKLERLMLEILREAEAR